MFKLVTISSFFLRLFFSLIIELLDEDGLEANDELALDLFNEDNDEIDIELLSFKFSWFLLKCEELLLLLLILLVFELLSMTILAG
jgi:hypothetical protein